VGVHSCRHCGTLVCGKHQVGLYGCRTCTEETQKDFERKGGGKATVVGLSCVGAVILGVVLLILGVKAGGALIGLGIVVGIVCFIWIWIAANT
jgi:hypothetical protein